MKKLFISLIAFLSIFFISSFSLATNYPAPFENVNTESPTPYPPAGYSCQQEEDPTGERPFITVCRIISNSNDVSTSLSSALAISSGGANKEAYALFTESTALQLNNGVQSSNDPTKKLKTEEVLWSEQSICKFTNGCSADKCYPFGTIKEGLYCAGSDQGFVKQQTIHGDLCSYDFQCSSNFCFNNQCVSNYQSLIKDVLTRIYALESRLGLDLKEINIEEQQNDTIETLEVKENKVSGFFKRLLR